MNKKMITRMVCICSMFLIGVLLLSQETLASTKGFIFKQNKVSISIDSKAKTFIKKAGKANKVKRENSCAFNGYDRTYEYDDYVLKTYSKTKNGAEYVMSIEIITDDVNTPEGITIGSTKNEMIKEYGKNKGEFGVYTYTKGKTKLVIELDDNDKVIYLAYVAK